MEWLKKRENEECNETEMFHKMTKNEERKRKLVQMAKYVKSNKKQLHDDLT